ncbi:hypothetical protein R3P38DRAFT_3227405 [Favolaschia claudopus]|uniref:Uncharacterized protein n=1 Tax=Favolaschia claudopus TaxID=2862362 RepID=A0AAV9ZRX5_9AGAR
MSYSCNCNKCHGKSTSKSTYYLNSESRNQLQHVHLLESTAAGQAAGSGSGQDSNGSGGEENDTSSPDLRRSLSRSPEPPPKKPRLEDQGNPSLHPSLADQRVLGSPSTQPLESQPEIMRDHTADRED